VLPLLIQIATGSVYTTLRSKRHRHARTVCVYLDHQHWDVTLAATKRHHTTTICTAAVSTIPCLETKSGPPKKTCWLKTKQWPKTPQAKERNGGGITAKFAVLPREWGQNSCLVLTPRVINSGILVIISKRSFVLCMW